MDKLFDYFIISAKDDDGIIINVKSKELEKFFRKYDCQLLSQEDHDGKITSSYYYANSSDWLIGDRYLRNSLGFSTRPRFAYNTHQPTFRVGMMPYLGFLCDSRIGDGLKFVLEMPLTKPELKIWYNKIVEYSQRLKREIERIEISNQPLIEVKAQ